jgi:hypothetical protein
MNPTRTRIAFSPYVAWIFLGWIGLFLPLAANSAPLEKHYTLMDKKYEKCKGEEFQDGMGWMNADGEVLVDPEKYRFFNVQQGFDGGFIRVADRHPDHPPNIKKLMDCEGNVYAHDFYDQMFNEDMTRIEEGGKFGFFDHDGEVAIKPQFEHVTKFCGGVAKVGIDCTLQQLAPEEAKKRCPVPEHCLDYICKSDRYIDHAGKFVPAPAKKLKSLDDDRVPCEDYWDGDYTGVGKNDPIDPRR